jgi:metal-responsive CopG/Arc/MetJ family transcriptional regulator
MKMGKAKIKLEKDLLEKVKKYAEMSGYASPEEFITHCLEKELSKLEESDSEEDIKKKLKGLGYIS